MVEFASNLFTNGFELVMNFPFGMVASEYNPTTQKKVLQTYLNMSAQNLNFNTSKIPQVVSGERTSDDVTFKFDPPLRLPGKYTWEVGLSRIDTWNSIHNVKAGYKNNSIRYYNGTVWYQLVIPDGNYEIDDFNAMIHNAMFTNGDFNNADPANPTYYINLVPNYSTGRLVIQVTNGYQLDLSIGELHTIFGFDPIVVVSTMTGAHPVDITRGVDSWMVHCSITGGSYDNGIASDILYGFVPEVERGMAIAEKPFQVFFFPLKSTFVPGYEVMIENVRMYLTDQLGRPILLNGDDIVYRVILRPAPSVKEN